MEHIFYARRNGRLFFLFFMGAILPLLFTFLIVFVLKAQLGSYLFSIFEKKTMDNLASYHANIKRGVNSYFDHSIDVLERIGEVERFSTKELRLQLKLNPQFLTLGTINAQGIVTQVVSTEPVVEKTLGQNLSDKDYFKGVMRTKKIFISKPRVGAQSNITQINISIPLFRNGKIEGILCGFISLKQLTQDMGISNMFYEKYSILVDTDGTILTGSIPEKDKLINLKMKEPSYDKLVLSSRSTYEGDEYNFKNERVLTIAEKVSLAETKDMFLISFLKKDAFIQEEAGLEYTISKLTGYLVFIWIALCGILFMVYSVWMYHDDQR